MRIKDAPLSPLLTQILGRRGGKENTSNRQSAKEPADKVHGCLLTD